MTNILYITYSLEPAGAERVAFSLASKISREKYRPVVCSLRSGGPLVPQLALNGVSTHVLYKRRGLDPFVPWKLYRIIKSERIELIHTHNFSANFWGRITGILAGVRGFVCTEHSLCTHKTPLQRRIDCLLARHTDSIIAVSEAVRRSHIVAGKLPADKILTVYNGIDAGQFANVQGGKATRTKLSLGSQDPVVGIVASLTDPKDHKNFLEASARVAAAVPNARFVIVGDGPLRHDITRLIHEKGLGKSTSILGFREDRLDIISTFDVAVLSSAREGLPLTLLEYMALAKPIVVTDAGGMPEAVTDGYSGYIVPARNAGLLAARIIDLIHNRTKAMNMGLRASEKFRQAFVDELMVRRMEAIYESIMAN